MLIGRAVPGSSGVISATVVESDILGDFSHILGEIVGLRMVEIVGDPGMGAKLAKLPVKLGIALGLGLRAIRAPKPIRAELC